MLNDGFVAAYFPDGSVVVIKSGINYFYYPDAKKLNKETFATQRFSKYGQDIFVFAFRPQLKGLNNHYFKKGIQPYIASKAITDDNGNLIWVGGNLTEDDLYTDPAYGCNKNNKSGGAAYCTQLIFINGWKIPDNYPFKF